METFFLDFTGSAFTQGELDTNDFDLMPLGSIIKTIEANSKEEAEDLVRLLKPSEHFARITVDGDTWDFVDREALMELGFYSFAECSSNMVSETLTIWPVSIDGWVETVIGWVKKLHPKFPNIDLLVSIPMDFTEAQMVRALFACDQLHQVGVENLRIIKGAIHKDVA